MSHEPNPIPPMTGEEAVAHIAKAIRETDDAGHFDPVGAAVAALLAIYGVAAVSVVLSSLTSSR